MKKESKANWLEDGLSLIPKFTLVFSEEEYHEALDDLNVGQRYPLDQDDVTTAWVKQFHPADGSPSGGPCVVMLTKIGLSQSLDHVCGILAHEATHIYQHVLEHLGENKPGKEFEAYTIQHITTQLIGELFAKKFPHLLKKQKVVRKRVVKKRAAKKRE